jgi:hypothetical protein
MYLRTLYDCLCLPLTVSSYVQSRDVLTKTSGDLCSSMPLRKPVTTFFIFIDMRLHRNLKLLRM